MMPDESVPRSGPSDDELRKLFSILRQEDEAHAPQFLAARKAQRKKPALPLGRRLAGVSVFAATIFAALLWLRHEPPRPARPARPGQGSARVASITEWSPPTDFLLNTPGREILRNAPVIRLQLYLNSTGSPPDRRQRTR